eukprot:scaffold22937_cov73-Cyclotella_meneghiniana.AAC.8
MNSSENPPAAGISSFTTTNDDNSTSLSSALAETVANLACFGSSVRSLDEKCVGKNSNGNSNSSPRLMSDTSSMIHSSPEGNANGKAVSNNYEMADSNGAKETQLQPNETRQQREKQVMIPPAQEINNILQQRLQQEGTTAADPISNHSTGRAKENVSLSRGETISQRKSGNNASAVPCPPTTNYSLHPPLSSPNSLSCASTSTTKSSTVKSLNKTKDAQQKFSNQGGDSLSNTVASLATLSNFATPNRKPEQSGGHLSAPKASLQSSAGEKTKHSRSLSGPIVSGTAFSTVIALKNRGNATRPSPKNANLTTGVVKNGVSTSSNTGIKIPHQQADSKNPSAALAQIALVSNSISKSAITPTKSVRSINSHPAGKSETKKRPSPYDAKNSSAKKPARSRDGAPIIAGTAAAALAIATAARIATADNADTSQTIHGFGMVKDSATLDRMVSLSTKAILSISEQDNAGVQRAINKAKTPKVDRDTVTRVTPEESAAYSLSHASTPLKSTTSQPLHQNTGVQVKSSIRQLQHQKPSSAVTQSRQRPPSAVALSNQSISILNSSHLSSCTEGGKLLGGMDILADIISHVPPMAVPETSTTTTASKHSHHGSNVPAIPSYQEIYQEMGMSPKTAEASVDNLLPMVRQQYSHPSAEYSIETIHGNGSISDGAQSHRVSGHYAHPLSGEIEEGKELYTRKDLMSMGGHMIENKDVHGSMKEGADSIVLCNLERDIREGDGLCWFLYSCDRTNGGGALTRSYYKKRAIRVFRSSVLNGKYAAPYLDEDEDDEIGYRYDGLYMVRAVWDIHGNETEAFPCAGEEGWQTYFFTRLPKKPLDARYESGMQYNAMGLQELWACIQKMRGVRRPKKFEIPEAPLKLHPMKICAITGDKKDRKSSSYRPLKRHEPENISEKDKQNEQLFDSSSDEEEAPQQPIRGPAKRSESTSTSRSSRSPKIVPRPAPNKVVTPRPRMNSIHELRKTISPSAKRLASTETSDSSESETEPVKKPKVEPPRLNSQSPTRRPNNLAQVMSTLIPKRATAAKAEATNRDMLGKKKKRPYNRKDSTAAITRKRSKRPKHDDESSSSIDGVDPDVLTVGSRALVLYKGSLFKATVKKRREKDGKHDFQIHYDGNKKSNVHWVPADRIQKILSIALDTATVNKKPNEKKNKRGGWNKKKSDSSAEYEHDNEESKNADDDGTEEISKLSESKPQESDHDQDEDSVNSESEKAHAESSGHVKPDSEAAQAKDDMNPKVESAEEEQVVEQDTSQSNDTSTNNSESKRVDVIDVVEVVTKPTPDHQFASKKKSISSSCDIDAQSLDSGPTSDIEEKHEPSGNGKSEEQGTDGSLNGPKFPVGTHVYVEYRRVFYTSTILQTRQKRKLTEYLVHYEGFKKASDRWVKETNIHEVNSDTTARFEEQRFSSSKVAAHPDLSGPADSTMITRGKSDDIESHNPHFTRQKKPPSRSRSDASDITHLGDIESGVAFLPGSVVFVKSSGELYLAKMVKKRFSGDRTEYLISYDGYDSDYDAWNSIHNIYEVNPKTKRVYNKMNAEIKSGTKPKRPDPPKNKQERKRR